MAVKERTRDRTTNLGARQRLGLPLRILRFM